MGVVICEGSNLLYKEIIDFKTLNATKNNNKKRHEKFQSIKHIISLARHWHCSAICIEKLNMRSKDHQKGKIYNRLINNSWHKNLLINSIKKHCILNNLKCIEVHAAYSSVLGSMYFDEIDSIAAALELNNRAQSALLGKRYIIQPENIDFNQLTTRWKKMLSDLSLKGHVFMNFAEMYNFLKKSKISYRLLFTRSLVSNSLRLMSWKNCVEIHNFT